tara:strand:- start:2158 stop:2490 length:333 start_codon:yes stop_codon:yes gene_type:complete
MRTFTKIFTGLSGTTEATAMDLKVQEHGRQTWEFYADNSSANIRIRLKSIFTDAAGTEVATPTIQTIDLTDQVLTIVNFDMKIEHVRCTYDDDGTGAMAGDLHIKATTAK